MRKKGVRSQFLRRLSQFCCLLIFFFLFIKTDYSGRDELPYAVNLLFRIDPLLAACACLAGRTLIALMIPALVLAGLALVLGRFFCGWVCPMGTLLDYSHPLLPPKKSGQLSRLGSVKYGLLVFLLAGAFFGLPLAGYLDPFSILVRGLALAIYPAFHAASASFFTLTYQQAPAWINAITEPLYAFLKDTLLPLRQHYFELVFLTFAILLVVFLLERLERRFFCRNLCPLGGLYAVLARWSLLRGRAGGRCGKCGTCTAVCRMGAIDEQRRIAMEDCNLCMDCVVLCPAGKIAFTFQMPAVSRSPEINSGHPLSRRAFVASLAAGVVLPSLLGTRAMARRADPFLIRPPGALPEEAFLGRCVRCGECMKVCIGNALQPTWLSAGLEGIFTPGLSARLGYCEYNCTLCGQVCPSGAISRLSLAEKQRCKIGHAFFDKNRCLPYAKAIPCIVCEEHCPTPRKAIQFREAEVRNSQGQLVTVKQPYIRDELCIGCGICETRCPLPGDSAVRVTSAGESRNPGSVIPTGLALY